MGYNSLWNHKAGLILDVLEDTKARFPRAWNNAHNPKAAPNKRDREEYCQRACWALRAAGIPAGMNGKRGNPSDLSEDIVNLPNVDESGNAHGGAPDTSGRYLAIEIRDVIGGAGPDKDGNQAGRVVFGDATQETLNKREVGCYVDPDPAYKDGATTTPPPVTPPPVTTPPPTPPPTTGGGDIATLLRDILYELKVTQEQNARILTGIGALATQQGNLESKLLDTGGAFDMQTKRIFGVDGSGATSVAQDAVNILTNTKDLGTLDSIGCRLNGKR